MKTETTSKPRSNTISVPVYRGFNPPYELNSRLRSTPSFTTTHSSNFSIKNGSKYADIQSRYMNVFTKPNPNSPTKPSERKHRFRSFSE